ncbi:MAG TPA: acyloxyacyl hydrolase [Gammaproteobacteria bacterium]|jgi:hypothetical protein|nr:acyloxyacyl hydrolase [Gammaproteobacteria bacterium]
MKKHPGLWLSIVVFGLLFSHHSSANSNTNDAVNLLVAPPAATMPPPMPQNHPITSPRYGATFSYVAKGLEPTSLHGFQFMLLYDPHWYWKQFNLYFDGGFSHFWVTDTPYYTTLNIYSIAPVLRYSFKKYGAVLPYVELSIGVAYLNHTRLDHRNLGMHFAFQDRVGVGIALGKKEQFSLGMHAVHYSNASLCSRNSGITAPLVVDMGYRF